MDPLFEVHLLNEQGKSHAQSIAVIFNGCLDALRKVCPEHTREFSIVKTKLEEAAFFAKKSMAMMPENLV